MALAKNDVDTKVRGTSEVRMPAGGAAFHGSLLGLDIKGNGGQLRKLIAYNDIAGVLPVGFNIHEDGAERGVAAAASIREVAVSNLTDPASSSNVGKLIYANDDDTFNTDSATLGDSVGMVVNDISTTKAEVLFFSMEGHIIQSLLGGNLENRLIAVVTGDSSGSPVTVADNVEMAHNGIIDAVYAQVIQPLSGAGADVDYTLTIDGTPVTGGSMNVVLADGAGDKKAGSAISANNSYDKNSVVDVILTENTASTAGLVGIYARIRKELGQ